MTHPTHISARLAACLVLLCLLALGLLPSPAQARSRLAGHIANAPVYVLTQTVSEAGDINTRAATATHFDTTGGATLDLAGFANSPIAASLSPLSPVGVAQARDILLNQARYNLATQRGTFIEAIAAHLRSVSVPIAWYTYEQLVRVTINAEGSASKHMKLIWNLRVDASGNPMYGDPRLVDPDPYYLLVGYVPVRVAENLPAEWAYADAGKLTWRLVNGKLQDLGATSTLDVGGMFDEPIALDDVEFDPDAGLKCLVDPTYDPGRCTNTVSVQSLLAETGAVAAVVDYVRTLEPVYDENEEGSETVYTPRMRWNVTERTFSCNILTNKGEYGYVLNVRVDRYLVNPDLQRPMPYMPLAVFQEERISAIDLYEKTASSDELAGRDPASTIISPIASDTQRFYHIDQLPPSLLNSVVGIAYFNPTTEISGFNIMVGEWMQDGNGETWNFRRNFALPETGQLLPNFQYAFPPSSGLPYTIYTLEFDLASAADVEVFELSDLLFDDAIELWVNGTPVYRGPSQMLPNMTRMTPENTCFEVCVAYKEVVCGDGACSVCDQTAAGSCTWGGLLKYRDDLPATHAEFSRLWSQPEPRDVRQHLVTGRNIITVRHYVRGSGEFSMKLNGHQCKIAQPMPGSLYGPPAGVRQDRINNVVPDPCAGGACNG